MEGLKRSALRAVAFVLAASLASDLKAAAGDLLWSRTFTSPDPGPGYNGGFSDTVVDDQGNVYAAGDYDAGNGSLELFVVKLDPAGAIAWTLTIGGTTRNETAAGLSLGTDGDLYVAGYQANASEGTLWVGRVSPAGTLVWSRTHNAPGGWLTYGHGVVADGSDVFVAAATWDPTASRSLAYLVKYQTDGSFLLSRTAGGEPKLEPGPEYILDRTSRVTAGADANPYWAFSSSAKTSAVELLKTDRSLNVVWSRTLPVQAPGALNDVYALVPYLDGVLVAGQDVLETSPCCAACGIQDKYRTRLMAVAGNGDLRWTASHLEPGVSHTVAYALRPGPDGTFYAAGHAGWWLDNSWNWVARFGASGNLLWSRSYPGGGWQQSPSNCFHREWATGVTVNAAGSLVACGYDSVFDGWVARIDPSLPSTIPPPPLVPPPLISHGAALDRNVVGLGAGETVVVRLFPKNRDPLTIAVYTASGRRVRTLDRIEAHGADQWVARWDGRSDGGVSVARGIYLVRVSGGGLAEVLKVAVK